MRERALFEIRSKIGMLFQESALFDSLNIEENVAYPLLNQPSIHCAEDEVQPRVEEALKFVELEGTLEKFPERAFGRHAPPRGYCPRRGYPTRRWYCTIRLRRVSIPITANTIMALIVKERDLNKTTTLIVTYRYQDGNLVANFRYNPDNGHLEPIEKNDGRAASRTVFMVLREGRLIFEGPQSELEASQDPYVAKFVKRRE